MHAPAIDMLESSRAFGCNMFEPGSDNRAAASISFEDIGHETSSRMCTHVHKRKAQMQGINTTRK